VTLVIALAKTIIAEKSSINRHAVEASKRLSTGTVSNTFRTDWTQCWFINMVLPFAKHEKLIIG
jgi:hypothetical protein